MNKLTKQIFLGAFCAALMFLSISVHAQTTPAKPSDDFFVVSSVDRVHNALILLKPTEIAVVYQLSDKTQYFDENGKPLKLSDFHAGDTIFATSHSNSDGTFTLDRIRKGDMTVNELRRRFPDLAGLPANAGITSQTMAPARSKSSTPPAAPKTNTGKPGAATPGTTKKGATTPKTTTTTPAKPKSGSTTPTNPKSGQTSH